MTTVTNLPKTTRFQELLKAKITKDAEFMGATVQICKLSTSQIMEIQKMTDQATAAATTAATAGVDSTSDMDDNLEMLIVVIKMSVAEAADVAVAEFKAAPLGELAVLSEAIMSFSGLGDKEAGK